MACLIAGAVIAQTLRHIRVSKDVRKHGSILMLAWTDPISAGDRLGGRGNICLAGWTRAKMLVIVESSVRLEGSMSDYGKLIDNFIARHGEPSNSPVARELLATFLADFLSSRAWIEEDHEFRPFEDAIELLQNLFPSDVQHLNRIMLIRAQFSLLRVRLGQCSAANSHLRELLERRAKRAVGNRHE